MSTERVALIYDIQGAQEGAAEVAALAEAQRAVGAESATASEHIGTFERSVSGASTGSSEFARVAQESTQQAIQFGQRMQAAASAVQGLASAFGGNGEAAGLIARTTQSSVAFAQLGGVLGPGGALVGGIVGAAIPAFQHLAQSEDAARTSAELLTVSLNTLISTTERAFAQANLQNTLQQGGGTIAEQSGFLQQAENRRQLIERALGGDPGAIRALRAQGLTGRADTDPTAMDVLRSALGGGAQTQLQDDERALLNQLADTAAARVVERVGLLEDATTRATETRLASPTTRPRGGGGGGASENPFERGQAEADWQMQWEALLADGEQAAADARMEALDDEYAANERIVEQKLQWQHELDTADKRAAQQERQRSLAALAAEERLQAERARTHREYLASIQDELSALDGVGQSIGATFSDAFQIAIQGQGDFGAALEDGLKKTLLQYGTQMVVEGTGALLTAAGLAFLNPPAAAGKAIEGAGKIALGVGLGAAGAAINGSGGSAGGASGRPSESPRGGAGNDAGKGGAPTIVINMNASTVMGGTHAEVGRNINRTAATALQRYGRAA